MRQHARPVLAAAFAGVSMWLLAGLWHTVLMATFYTERVDAAHEGVATILVAYLVLAALMTWIYRLRATTLHPLRDGVMVGAVVGVLWVFPHELALAAAHGEPLAYVFENGAWHVVEQALGGLVIGALHGKGSPLPA